MSLLPTPTVNDSRGGRNLTSGRSNPDSQHHDGMTLVDAVRLLPTPRASDQRGPGVHGPHGLDLRTAVSLLPTPQARDGQGRGTPNEETAARRMFDEGRRNLEDAVALPPTPKARDGKGPEGTTGQEGRRGVQGLSDAVALMSDVQSWVVTLPDGRTIDYGPAVRRWEQIFGEAHPPPRDEQGRENVDLPRWMLGFPSGWVDGVPRTGALRVLGNSCQPQTSTAATVALLPELVG